MEEEAPLGLGHPSWVVEVEPLEHPLPVELEVLEVQKGLEAQEEHPCLEERGPMGCLEHSSMASLVVVARVLMGWMGHPLQVVLVPKVLKVPLVSEAHPSLALPECLVLVLQGS